MCEYRTGNEILNNADKMFKKKIMTGDDLTSSFCNSFESSADYQWTLGNCED